MKEIERKFLVDLSKLDISRLTNWTSNIKQGYLCEEYGYAGHVDKLIRIRTVDNKAFITIKGDIKNITRNEFEYEIPYEDAIELMKMCNKKIIKKRITVKYDKKYWAVDIFNGENEGLVVGEIELSDEKEKINLPPWVTKEVSNDPRYYNINLTFDPYKNWR